MAEISGFVCGLVMYTHRNLRLGGMGEKWRGSVGSSAEGRRTQKERTCRTYHSTGLASAPPTPSQHSPEVILAHREQAVVVVEITLPSSKGPERPWDNAALCVDICVGRPFHYQSIVLAECGWSRPSCANQQPWMVAARGEESFSSPGCCDWLQPELQLDETCVLDVLGNRGKSWRNGTG
jgi:hypothetical protein